MKNNLRVLRAQQKISQAEIAEKIKVSRQTINAIEAGKYVPSTILALRLAKYFQIAVEQVFELEPEDI